MINKNIKLKWHPLINYNEIIKITKNIDTVLLLKIICTYDKTIRIIV